jgi:hypothetical protein
MATEVENNLVKEFSTYSLITAEQIFERYGIKLNKEELLNVLSDPHNIYHRLLQVPLENVLNGIILDQIRAYQAYAQKSFIDYLLSGEAGKTEEAPGAAIRESLESERQALVQMGEKFHRSEFAQDTIIAESQQIIKQSSKEFQKIQAGMLKAIQRNFELSGINIDEKLIIEAINALLSQNNRFKGAVMSLEGRDWAGVEQILGQSLPANLKQDLVKQLAKLQKLNSELDVSLEGFSSKISDMTSELRKWRIDFHELILRVNTMIRSLPEYSIDQTQIQENREALFFDPKIGESS